MKITKKEKLKEKYFVVRKKFLEIWTKISEEKRKKFISFLDISFNYLQNALLISVPVMLLLHISYWKSVICIWIILPFLEHYYIWIRETWKDDILK